MRRKKTGQQKAYRSYDFLTEIDPKRLQLIGAITLAWNWIEGAIDASLAIGLEVHPDMWIEVSSRINGMDGKLALLRRSLSLDGYPTLPDGAELSIRKTINSVEAYKKLRDGIMHARLVHPEALVADTSQRKGVTDEVLVSRDALEQLYNRLGYLVREADELVILYFFRWRLSEEGDAESRRQAGVPFLQSLAQL